MRIFFDCEFTNLDETAELISIGFVADDPQQVFYAELAEWSDCAISDFTREVVVPILEMIPEDRLSSVACARAIAEWLASFDAPIELVSDSAWDWRLFKRLLALSGADEVTLDTPSGKACHLRYRLFEPANATEERLFFEATRSIYQGRQHHALVDARALRAGYMAIAHHVNSKNCSA